MVTRNPAISFFHLRGITVIRKVGKKLPPLEDKNLPRNSYLSPIISPRLADIPAENCRGFRFHSGLNLLYLNSSLSWNILLSQPLSHHWYTLTCANWHRIVKGSSYRFIPPSCDLSRLRFGPGRIQKPVTGPGARTGKFFMKEMLLEAKRQPECPPGWICKLHFQLWGKQAKLIRQAR